VLRRGFGVACLQIGGAGAGVRPVQIQTDVISNSVAGDVKCVMLRWLRTACKTPDAGLSEDNAASR